MDVLDIINRMLADRRDKKIVPDHILMPDLFNEIEREAKKEINELYSLGSIGIVKTVNNRAVYVKPK